MSFEIYIEMLKRNGNVSVRAERANSFERECSANGVRFRRGRAITRGDGSVRSYVYYLGSQDTKYSGLYA